MRPHRSAILMAAALVSGCSGAQTLLRGGATARTVCPDGVVFFPSAGEVPGNYREVALLSKEGVLGREEARWAGAMYRLHAGELGANGIVLTSSISRDAGAKVIGPAIGDPSVRQGMAVAVYIPSDSSRVGEACLPAQASAASATVSATVSAIVSATASATVSASRDLPFVSSAVASSRSRSPAVHRKRAGVRPFDLSGRRAQAVRPAEEADSGQSAAFIHNQDVRSALTNLERLKIVTGAEEVRPGLVRLSIGEMAPVAQMEYHIGYLHGSYQAALPYGANAVVELWSGGSKMGEYTKEGLVFNEAP